MNDAHAHDPVAAIVRVEPATLPWLEALADGDATFTERFGITVEPGWLVFPESLPYSLDQVRAHGPDPWGFHLFFDGTDGALVGNGGWVGPPTDGVAELGYAVAEGRRGRGLATAVVEVLLDRGRAAGVEIAVAHTLPDPSASTTVLERCGFTHVGTEDDPDEGPVWRWERPLTP